MGKGIVARVFQIRLMEIVKMIAILLEAEEILAGMGLLLHSMARSKKATSQ
jgi:hypothetical protein